MDITSILFIGIGLAADAVAVSICKGLTRSKLLIRELIVIGLWFGLFQTIMPIIGYVLGSSFNQFISIIDHWISFLLLIYIGINMIFERDKEDNITSTISIKEMFMLAVATSIDALAVGITFSFLEVNLLLSVIVIGIITFVLSIFGVLIGYRFGSKYKSISRIIGGIILIFIGFRILFTHLFL